MADKARVKEAIERIQRRGTRPQHHGGLRQDEAGDVVVPSDTEIDDAEVDVAKRLRWELWDGVAAVGGLSSVDVKNRYPGMDAAYIVYVDGDRAIFQAYDPSEPGLVPMSAQRAREVAKEEIARMTRAMVPGTLLHNARESDA